MEFVTLYGLDTGQGEETPRSLRDAEAGAGLAGRTELHCGHAGLDGAWDTAQGRGWEKPWRSLGSTRGW